MSLDVFAVMIKWDKTYVKNFAGCFNKRFPGGSDSKESACNTGGPDSVPGWGRYPHWSGATHCSILAWRIPMDRGAWQATVHVVAESWT